MTHNAEKNAREMAEAVVYDTLMDDAGETEDADTFDLARRVMADLIESGACVLPPAERHNRGCAAGVAPSAACTCPLPPAKGAHRQALLEFISSEAGCGGCRNMGSHKRWCARKVGFLAAVYGPMAEQLEDMGDRVGPNHMGLSNQLWSLSAQMREWANSLVRDPNHSDVVW